ncbi:GNAT family N-acetyltransferase [Nostoc sp. T09]|uniref:GNAT family N-acetyltransferase n=1 Tax=Nostoc sp. T09 TaxID=1932621 RepID=UPI000A377538|nr:GNAT family N-acetyltransferase [Nostoc sp. T09]OUL28042.1 GNAT family N-acetyltransferase [Nostoc sp. T09]
MLKIIQFETEKHQSHLHQIWEEYCNWSNLIFTHELGISFDVSQFLEQYMSQLEEFVPPSGRLLLGEYDNKIAGCACLRNIGANIGEIKRMYVRPEFQRKGIGRSLLIAIINEASHIGYAKLRLDTAPFTKAALSLYRSLGFYEIEPYFEKTEILLEYRNNWVFMELSLTS